MKCFLFIDGHLILTENISPNTESPIYYDVSVNEMSVYQMSIKCSNEMSVYQMSIKCSNAESKLPYPSRAGTGYTTVTPSTILPFT